MTVNDLLSYQIHPDILNSITIIIDGDYIIHILNNLNELIVYKKNLKHTGYTRFIRKTFR